MPFADPVKKREYDREYYQKNKKKLRPIYAKNKRLRYQADPEKGREMVRKWRKNNPEKSAECNRRWHRENKDKLFRYKNPYRIWVITTLSNHRKKGCKINISTDDLEKLAKTTKKCIYCNKKLIFQYGKGLNRNTPSLDRINNGNEINLNNIQIICHECNSTKRGRTHKEFVEYSRNIVRKFG